MKKIICFLLSLIVVLNINCILTVNAAGLCEQVGYGVSIDDFFLQAKKLLSESLTLNEDIKANSQASFCDDEKSAYREFYTKRLIVKSKDKINIMKATGVAFGYKDLWVLQFKTIEETALAYEYYNSQEGIEYVETDDVVELDSVGAFSNFSENSYLDYGADVIGTNEVKEYLNNTAFLLDEVKVGIVDSGIDYEHEFFKSRLIDNGLNFSTSGEEHTAMSDDPESHGTHVAGIVVNNTLDNVKIKGYKVFDLEGKTSDLCVALAVYKAIEDKMDVLNMSFSSAYSETIEESLQEAYDSGMVLISSAGNDAKSIGESLPANFKGTITVAAANENGAIADFSNYGYQIDVAAPGVNIYSTVDDNKYGYLSGTSMSAPFVSACVATLLSLNSDITQEEIEIALKESALPIEGSICFAGSGMVNIAEAISYKNTNLPQITYKDGFHHEPVSVSYINGEQMEIYYTLDGSIPDKTNGILYSGTFIVEKTSDLKWRAYYKDESKFRSKTYVETIKILPIEDETNFEIDESGELVAYYGNETDFSVPESIRGITVNSVGYDVFSNKKCPQVVNIMLPETIKTIGEYAFKNNQSIETVVANGVETIEARAFDSCVSLKEIYIPRVEKIQKYAFNKCYDLNYIDLESLEIIEDYAFRLNKSLVDIKLDSLKSIGQNVFVNSMIREIEFSALETFQAHGKEWTSNALNGCDLLESLYFPELITLGDIRKVSEGFNSLDNLKCFFAPKLRVLGNYTFYHCSLLQNINIDSVEHIGDEAFCGCRDLTRLNLPKVKYVGFNVFEESGIEWLYFEVVEEINSLPAIDCTVFVPSTTKTIGESQNRMHIRMYGSTNTFVEEWSKKNHEGFSCEFVALPVMVIDLPNEISEGQTCLTLEAVGFDLTYQWFAVKDQTESDAEPIIGATSKELVLSENGDAKGYYCVVSNNDNGIITQVVSNTACVRFVSADYTEYYNAVKSVPDDLSIYTGDSVLALKETLEVDVSGKTTEEQNLVDAQTAAIIQKVLELEIRKADYSELNKVIEKVPKDLSDYTPESVSNLESVISNIDYTLDITQQKQVDEYCDEVSGALSDLKEEHWIIRFFRKVILFFNRIFTSVRLSYNK